MAILYGTTGDGTTLPVLVDQFGNLLAKGIDGPVGPPGPPGVGQLPPDPYEGAILGWENGELAWVSTPVPLPAGTYGPFTYENGILQVPQLVTWLPGRDLFMSDALGIPFTYQCETDLITTVKVTGPITTLFFPSSDDFDQFSVGEVVQYGGNLFTTTLYTGTGAEQTINTVIDNTGKSLVWIKNRDDDLNHTLCDTVRGAGNWLVSNSPNKSTYLPDVFKAFTPSGFTVVDYDQTNKLNTSLVAWNFRAAPGFMDIQTWKGQSPDYVTIPHNLGSAPGMFFFKSASNDNDWLVYHQSLGKTFYLSMNNTWQALDDAANMFPIEPDSQNIYIGGLAQWNDKDHDYVGYLFADTPGTIKCGSYEGNSAASHIINCGFKPGWVMIKAATATGDWCIFDDQRGTDMLQANEPSKEEPSSNKFQGFYDNGFTVLGGYGNTNLNGVSYIYVAIAENAATPGSHASIVSKEAENYAITVDGGIWSGTDGSGDPEGQTKLEKAKSGSGTVLSTSGETIALDQDNGEWVDGYYVTSPETTVAAYKLLAEEVRRTTKQDPPKT